MQFRDPRPQLQLMSDPELQVEVNLDRLLYTEDDFGLVQSCPMVVRKIFYYFAIVTKARGSTYLLQILTCYFVSKRMNYFLNVFTNK